MLKHNFILLAYNKDITCIMDPVIAIIFLWLLGWGEEPVCSASPRINRRSNADKLPSHDPYIPRNNTILFNCSVECNLASFTSMTDLVSPNLNLKSCFTEATDKFICEPLRYHHLKNADKLIFLSKTVRNKTFYIVDCLVYSGGERVCHKKDNADSYANLVDMGTLARPKDSNILSQDEFICEESKDKEVKCDLNSYVPFDSGLKLKESEKFGDTVLLKTGSYVVILTRKCIGLWCGYTGRVSSSRRSGYGYRVPGDSVYRCFYAKKQRVCKWWYSLTDKEIYNQRGFINT